MSSIVPNVPCGVERPLIVFKRCVGCIGFLMYRVELKAGVAAYSGGSKKEVPNVPCGVESTSQNNRKVQQVSRS